MVVARGILVLMATILLLVQLSLVRAAVQVRQVVQTQADLVVLLALVPLHQ